MWQQKRRGSMTMGKIDGKDSDLEYEKMPQVNGDGACYRFKRVVDVYEGILSAENHNVWVQVRFKLKEEKIREIL